MLSKHTESTRVICFLCLSFRIRTALSAVIPDLPVATPPARQPPSRREPLSSADRTLVFHLVSGFSYSAFSVELASHSTLRYSLPTLSLQDATVFASLPTLSLKHATVFASVPTLRFRTLRHSLPTLSLPPPYSLLRPAHPTTPPPSPTVPSWHTG